MFPGPPVGPPSYRRRRRPTFLIALAAAVPLAFLAGGPTPSARGSESLPRKAESIMMSVAEPQSAPRSQGAILVALPWGQGPGQVGLQSPQEGLARGPEALAVAPDGRLVVLDGVNGRLLLLSAAGTPTATVPLDLTSPRFVAATNQTVSVLDADSDRQVQVFDWDGASVATYDLPAVDEPATALLAGDDGLAVEYAHDHVERLEAAGDLPLTVEATARPADRQAPGRSRLVNLRPIPGRALGPEGQSHAQARLRNGKAEIRIERGAGSGGGTITELQIDTAGAIEQLVALGAGEGDSLILGARAATPPGSAQQLWVTLLPLGDPPPAEPPPAMTIDDQDSIYLGDPLVIGPGGTVYQPVASPEGYSIRLHRFAEGGSR